MIPTLRQLYTEHHGKVSDKWSSYLETYDDILSQYRNDNIRLLEIGIQNGGSLEIWSKYFPQAKLFVGCDIDENCNNLRYTDARIQLIVGDATKSATEVEILKNSKSFDLILDDGSHRSGDIVATFARYYGRLTDGGMYIAEDLHCSYWKNFQGGLFDPHSSINFFKALADLVNFDHWGVDGKREDLLKTFTTQYDCEFSEEDLSTIHSIEFRNSMCIVKKKRSEQNHLGQRIIAGEKADVFPFILSLKGAELSATYKPEERANEWSNLKFPPQNEVFRLRMDNSILRAVAAENQSALQSLSLRMEQTDEKLTRTAQELLKRKNSEQKAREAFALLSAESGERISRLRSEAEMIQQHVTALEEQAKALRASTSWRITAPLRAVTGPLQRQKGRLRTILRAMKPGGGAERTRIWAAVSGRSSTPAVPLVVDDYAEWTTRFDTLHQDDIDLISRHIAAQPPPKLVIVWLWPQGFAGLIDAAVASLSDQFCSNWSAVFVTQDEPAISDGLKKAHSQIFFKTKLNSGDLKADSDSHVVVIKAPGVLAKHATYMMGMAVRDQAAVVYCDEDIASAEKRSSPRFAPKFSAGYDAIGNIALFPTSPDLAAALSENSVQAIDLSTLCATLTSETALPVRHLPFVLFHNHRAPPAGSTTHTSNYLEESVDCPSVNIIIPTRDGLELLVPCINSILRLTDYPRDKYRITVVDNGSTDPAVIKYLDEKVADHAITVIRDPSKFNYSRLNNFAVRNGSEDLLAFVNNDIEVLDPKWLRRLAYYATNRRAGAIGAKLLYPDRTVQHGGIILGIQGVAAHAHHGLPATAPGYMGLSSSTHPISAVTGACLMVRRSVFEEVGGFDENLEVAFNDVLLCMEISQRGYENIYIGDPLLLHFESKTRGLDDTIEKKRKFDNEARYARRHGQDLFQNDPYYNSNLSLENAYSMAFPPRVERPWNKYRRESTGRLRLLMLSITHQIGHGVAVVLDLQARRMVSEGHEVFIGGPRANSEFAYPGCSRIYLDDPKDAAVFAVENGIDCIVMHTPPFYSTSRWIGGSIRTLAYDYGEPSPHFFPEVAARQQQLDEKDFCLEMADALYAISESVKAESSHDRMGIIPLGNSHLATWNDSCVARRLQKRQELELSNAIVVLNVCRFHSAERNYKGVDDYCKVRRTLEIFHPELMKDIVFVLAGKGNEADVLEMQANGLRVFANVTDEQLVDLYCCADIYANFSKWEGYNLGIGQAQAMGLPIVASDIPAHRAFGVFVSNDPVVASDKIASLSRIQTPREPKISDWKTSLDIFSAAMKRLNPDASPPERQI